MRHYLDHAATTPLRPEAPRCLAGRVGDGRQRLLDARSRQDARRLLEESRERVSRGESRDPIEIVFTSGGTESINLALQGLWHARPPGSSAIVLPDGEHHATMDTVAALVDEGAELRRVLVTPEARIDPEEFAALLPGAALATALVANNEAGTINRCPCPRCGCSSGVGRPPSISMPSPRSGTCRCRSAPCAARPEAASDSSR